MEKFLVILCLLGFMYSHSAVADDLPYSTIRKGSLSNPKLIHDAKVGVVSKVVTLGCNKPESFVPYILEMPQGEVGSRYSRELWVVKGCKSEYPVKTKFSETGMTGANWVIEK